MELIKNLKPVQYRFKNNNNNRLHTGFISQDIEKTILKNYGVFVKKDAYIDEDGKEIPDFYGLRYSELVAILCKSIQDLNKKVESGNNSNSNNVDELESDGDFSMINTLQSRVHQLESDNNKLSQKVKKLTTAVNKLLKLNNL